MVPVRRHARYWLAYLAAGGFALAVCGFDVAASAGKHEGQDASTKRSEASAKPPQPPIPIAAPQPPQTYVFPYKCEKPKDAEQDNLCLERRSAEASEHQADWARYTFWLGFVGTGFVVLTLIASGWAAYAAWRAARTAERALTDLERPFLCAVVTKRGIDSIEKADTWDTQVKFDLSDMELSICNYGRTPAILSRLEWEITTAPAGEVCRAIDPQAIGGREMPAGVISAPGAPFTEIGMPHGILWHGREDIEKLKRIIWVLGFVRYSDVLGGNHISGFAMTFDFEIMRFVACGGASHNYTRKEKASEIPPPSTSK